MKIISLTIISSHLITTTSGHWLTGLPATVQGFVTAGTVNGQVSKHIFSIVHEQVLKLAVTAVHVVNLMVVYATANTARLSEASLVLNHISKLKDCSIVWVYSSINYHLTTKLWLLVTILHNIIMRQLVSVSQASFILLNLVSHVSFNYFSLGCQVGNLAKLSLQLLQLGGCSEGALAAADYHLEEVAVSEQQTGKNADTGHKFAAHPGHH